jgi:hypothetical protein
MGMSIGAQHYYGHLRGEKDRQEHIEVELKRTLTTRSARTLSKLDGDDYKWEKGDTTGRFDDEESIIAVARACWRGHFPEADTLILGRSVVAEPQPVLEGPEDFKTRVNAWVTQEPKGNTRSREWNDICDEFWDYFRAYCAEAEHG